MNLPFEYERVTLGEFGGTPPTTATFEDARVVILPMPLDRTTCRMLTGLPAVPIPAALTCATGPSAAQSLLD